MSFSEIRLLPGPSMQNITSDPQERQAQLSLTQGIVLTHNKDQLQKRLQEDEEFKNSFYEAISFPPAGEIQVPLASKIIQVLPPQNYPDWVREVRSKITDSPLTQRENEQAFLKQCAEGSLSSLPTDFDIAKVRDAEGRTGLHLALMHPSTAPCMLRIMFSHPQLLAVCDYEQNYPLDLHKNPSLEFLADLLLAVSDNHDPEVCNQVKAYLRANLSRTNEISSFLNLLIGRTDRNSFNESSARVGILIDVLLKAKNGLEGLYYNMSKLLRPNDLKIFVETSYSISSSLPVYVFFNAWTRDEGRMSAEECLEYLKFFATYQAFCLPTIIKAGFVEQIGFALTSIPEGREIFDFMLKTFPLNELPYTEFFCLIKKVNDGEENVNLVEAEKILVIFFKHSNWAANPNLIDLLKEIMNFFPESGAEILQLVVPKLNDNDLKYLVVHASSLSKEAKKSLSILDAEIRRRPDQDGIYFDLWQMAVYSCACKELDADSPMCLRVNEQLLKFLISDSIVFPRPEQDMLSVKSTLFDVLFELNFDEEAIKKVNIEQLGILIANGVDDLGRFFDESVVLSLLRDGQALNNVEWILLHVLKKLPFAELSTKRAKKFVGKIFKEVIRQLPQASSNNCIPYPSTFQEGSSYEIEPDETNKAIKLFYKKQGSQEKETLFYGFITYEKLMEMIQQHDRSKAIELMIERLNRTYASYIVQPAAEVEYREVSKRPDKGMAIKIHHADRKVSVHLCTPGKPALKIHEFGFDQLLKEPGAIEQLLENWQKEVELLINSLQQQIGKENCDFYSSAWQSNPSDAFLAVIPSNGQVIFGNRINPKRELKWAVVDAEKALEEFKKASKDANNIKELQKWASEKQGQTIAGRAYMLSRYFNDLVLHLDKPWVCLPWAGGGFWLFTRDSVSGHMLCRPAWDIKDKDKTLKDLMEIKEVLGGYVGHKEQLNALVKPSAKKLHSKPANVSLNTFFSVFDEIKTQGWFIERASKELTTVESLESNLRHFISCVTSKRGIVGWEDAVKHRQDYLDLEIYLTNTLEELQKRHDKQSLNQLVMELSKYGRYCGNKVSEICYQHYALTFGISNMETDADDLEDVLRNTYKQAFLETLELLVQFVGDPEAKCQTTHVLSYLRATLSDLGYLVPDDPKLPPHQQDGKNDRFHENWGSKDYPKDILEQIFPAICLPMFIRKFSQAQDELLKNQRFQTLGNMKQVLTGRIEMGFEGRISLSIDPAMLNEYSRLMQARKERIKYPKESVTAAETKLSRHEEKPFTCLKDAGHLESSLMNLSMKINEISEECLALSRKRQQMGMKLKNILADSQNQVEDPAARKRKSVSKGLPFMEMLSLENQMKTIATQQSLAEKSLDEMKKHRETVQTILRESSQQSSILGERESLRKELELRKKESEDILQDKSDLCRMVEKLCEKDGYLCEAPDDLTVLSLKGLLQVLLQKNVLIQSDNLQRQSREASAL